MSFWLLVDIVYRVLDIWKDSGNVDYIFLHLMNFT